MANAAFFYGLAKNLSDEIMEKGLHLPFSQAKDNFYQAARFGVDCQIIWMDGNKYRLHTLIKKELIPRAILGLKSLGVSTCDCEDFLDIILQRLNNKQNGCQWQRQFIQSNPDFTAMLQQYIKNQQSGKPVCEWSTE